MAYSMLLSIPVEVLTRIFELCDDFQQVIALASTCKKTHAAWVASLTTIIWNVARSHIISFDDALMAVRATAFVLKSYQAGNLPPAVPMRSLSGRSKLPDVAELKEVLNMRHLVRCIEYMYFYYTSNSESSDDSLYLERQSGRYPAERRRFPGCLQENIPGAKNATLDSFRENFYRAMYRLLLAGAELARTYMEPLFRARSKSDNGFYLRCDEGYYSLADAVDFSDGTYPTEADIAFIRQSPVYSYDVTDSSEIGKWRDQEYEACFGPFVSWIIEDGRLTEQNEPRNAVNMPAWAQRETDVAAIRELMLLLVAYDHLPSKFVNLRRPDEPAYLQKQGNRTATMVRFGIFQVEEVTMPANIDDLTNTQLYTQFHPALGDTLGKDIPYQFNTTYIFSFLEDKYRDPPWTWNRINPGPHPMLEMWHFALKRYFNLGFKSGTFWMPPLPLAEESTWWRDVGRGEIFLNPAWAPVQRYELGVTSWDIGVS